MLANVGAEIGGMPERWIAFLVDSTMSGLPPFLTADAGLSSGFMSSQIVAAALASENRQNSVVTSAHDPTRMTPLSREGALILS